MQVGAVRSIDRRCDREGILRDEAGRASGPEHGPAGAAARDPEVGRFPEAADSAENPGRHHSGQHRSAGGESASADRASRADAGAELTGNTGPIAVGIDPSARPPQDTPYGTESPTGDTGPVPIVGEAVERDVAAGQATPGQAAPGQAAPGQDSGSMTAPHSVPAGPVPPAGGPQPPPGPPPAPPPFGPGGAFPGPRPPVAGAQPQRGPLRPLGGVTSRGSGRRAGRPASPRPLRKGDRTAVAIVLHQFPIGHLPVAASEPSRQLPTEQDPEPSRHPRSELVDDTDALARVSSGKRPTPAQLDSVHETAEEDREIPADLLADHDPLGGIDRLEWEREYVLDGARSERTRYAWPEVSAGQASAGEPAVLEPDVVLDRLGDGWGRVLFPEGTAFGRRSEPAEHLSRPYRRYRVLRPLPVWRAITAAWFGQPGGAVQYRTTHPLLELEGLGYVVELTRRREVAEAGTLRLGAGETGDAGAGAGPAEHVREVER